MSKLVSKIQGMSKQKRIPAVVIDVLGGKCSVRLSTRGTILRNLSYFGPRPVSGDSVYVDYSSGIPTVMTSGALSEAASSSARSTVRGAPLESGIAKYHNDMVGIEGGLAATETDPAEYYHLTAAEYAALGGGPGGAGLPVAQGAGTVDIITANFSPDVTLTNEVVVVVIATGANTSATPTFAPDGLTAHTIVKKGGQALVAGDIPGEHAAIILEYNSAHTRWELLNPGGASGHTIMDENGSDMATETKLQFTGKGRVTDVGGTKTVVDIPAPYVDDDPPADPEDGDLWWDTDDASIPAGLYDHLILDAGHATPGGSPLKFTSGSLLTVPETGAVEFYDGRFYLTGSHLQRVIDRTGNVITASTNAVGSAETTIYTATLSAGAAKIGRIYKIHCDGVIRNKHSSDDVTFYFYRDGVLITSVTPAGKDYPVGTGWHLDYNETVRTVGALGTAAMHGHIVIGGLDTAFQSLLSSIDFTADRNLIIKAKWSDNSDQTENIVTIYQGWLELKN